MFGKLFELAKKRNIEQLEIYVYEKEELEIGLFHGEIDTYNVANLKTVSARGIFNGQMGYATSEKFAPGMEKSLIDSIIKNNAEKANYYALKTLRKVQKKVGFPERIR